MFIKTHQRILLLLSCLSTLLATWQFAVYLRFVTGDVFPDAMGQSCHLHESCKHFCQSIWRKPIEFCSSITYSFVTFSPEQISTRIHLPVAIVRQCCHRLHHLIHLSLYLGPSKQLELSKTRWLQTLKKHLI